MAKQKKTTGTGTSTGTGTALPREIKWYGALAAPEAKRDGISYGISTGLRLTHYLNEVLGEFALRGEPVDDAAVEAALRQEFPQRTKFQSIAAYCSYFNAGTAGFGTSVEARQQGHEPLTVQRVGGRRGKGAGPRVIVSAGIAKTAAKTAK